jgi:cellobiose-specific phosphotransferase system component IIA
VELAKDHPYAPWSQMGLGMAEYRHGNFAAADQALSAAEEAGKNNHWVKDASRFFHAMSLFRQGKEAEARQLFAEAEAQMKPLPADERQPLANGADLNDVVVWIAHKEAKALLESNATAVPAKP